MINRLNRKWWYIITQCYFKTRFANIGRRSLIYKPIQLNNISSIAIDNDVYIAEGAWLMGGEKGKNTLSIGSGVTVGHFSHIVGIHSLTIGTKVLIADKVFISDCTHEYEAFDTPVMDQNVKELSPVVIGDGSWIGENVCICGASIGKHCVIGSNSVVTNNIPDYCVAVGAPARIVKKYDKENEKWVRV